MSVEAPGARIVILMNLFVMFSAELNMKDSPGQTHSSRVWLSSVVWLTDGRFSLLKFVEIYYLKPTLTQSSRIKSVFK